MKRNFAQGLVFALLLLPYSLVIAAVETYIIDPHHSYVLWHINHFGFSNPSGKWMAEGTLVLEESKPQNSKVNVTIHVADVITGIPELDKHLNSKLFFDTEHCPTATFISNKVNLTGKKTAKVSGVLTVHGISKPIILNVTLNKMGENPITNKMSAGFSANTQLKRSEFDIKTLLPGLGDDVKINIELEAYKQTS